MHFEIWQLFLLLGGVAFIVAHSVSTLIGPPPRKRMMPVAAKPSSTSAPPESPARRAATFRGLPIKTFATPHNIADALLADLKAGKISKIGIDEVRTYIDHSEDIVLPADVQWMEKKTLRLCAEKVTG